MSISSVILCTSSLKYIKYFKEIQVMWNHRAIPYIDNCQLFSPDDVLTILFSIVNRFIISSSLSSAQMRSPPPRKEVQSEPHNTSFFGCYKAMPTGLHKMTEQDKTLGDLLPLWWNLFIVPTLIKEDRNYNTSEFINVDLTAKKNIKENTVNRFLRHSQGFKAPSRIKLMFLMGVYSTKLLMES